MHDLPPPPFYDLATISIFARMDDGDCLALLAAHDGQLVGVLAGAMGLHTARLVGHAGARGDETLEATPPLAEFFSSREPLGGEVLSFNVSAASAVAGARLAELPLPASSTVMLIVRAGQLLPPRGETRLEPGDYVWVVARPDARELVLLLFGAPDEE